MKRGICCVRENRDKARQFVKKSLLLEKLRGGEVANCIKLNVSGQSAFEIAALSGVDSIWVCREHVGGDWEAVERQSVVAKLYQCDLIVRVEKGSYSDYVKPLELDATGIMVPHVKSAAEARQIVQNTRFHPIGLRAWDGGNADGKYGQLSAREYMDYSNTEKMIILQIEDPEAVEDIDEICSVEGFDMVFFGPGDLSQAYGVPGELTHPRVREARKRVVVSARKHGKFAGTVTTPEMLSECLADGYRYVNIGADVWALAGAYAQMLTAFRTAVNGR